MACAIVEKIAAKDTVSPSLDFSNISHSHSSWMFKILNYLKLNEMRWDEMKCDEALNIKWNGKRMHWLFLLNLETKWMTAWTVSCTKTRCGCHIYPPNKKWGHTSMPAKNQTDVFFSKTHISFGTETNCFVDFPPQIYTIKSYTHCKTLKMSSYDVA